MLYPSSIITQRWNDVLSLTNQYFNGGYVFSDYEWYKNDIQITDANSSYYYTGGDDLDFASVYRARTTRTDDGVQIFTCGYVPVRVIDDIILSPNPAYRNQPVRISSLTQSTTVTVYNIMGMRVGQYQLSEYTNTFPAPAVSGTYIVIIATENGNVTEKILVE